MPGAFPRGGVVGLGAAGVGLGAPAAGIAAVRSDATVTSPAGLEAVTETRRVAPASAGARRIRLRGRARDACAAGAAPLPLIRENRPGAVPDTAGRRERAALHRHSGDRRRSEILGHHDPADEADSVVLLVRDQEIALGGDADALGSAQPRRRGRTAVSRASADAVADDGSDHPAGIDVADALVRGVGDQETAVWQPDDVVRIVQARRGCGPAVAAESRDAVAGDGRDHPGSGHPPDPFILDVRDQEATVPRWRNGERMIEQGCGGRAAVAAEACGARARHGGDHARRGDAPDPVVVRVRDQKAATRKRRHAARVVDRGARRGTAVTAEAGRSGTRNGA